MVRDPEVVGDSELENETEAERDKISAGALDNEGLKVGDPEEDEDSDVEKVPEAERVVDLDGVIEGEGLIVRDPEVVGDSELENETLPEAERVKFSALAAIK